MTCVNYEITVSFGHLLPECALLGVLSICRLMHSLQKETVMENMNIAQNTTVLPKITAQTTLGELLATLDLCEKPKMPTPKSLYEEDEPIADMNDCTLFRNGFVIYKNGTSRTAAALPITSTN